MRNLIEKYFFQHVFSPRRKAAVRKCVAMKYLKCTYGVRWNRCGNGLMTRLSAIRVPEKDQSLKAQPVDFQSIPAISGEWCDADVPKRVETSLPGIRTMPVAVPVLGSVSPNGNDDKSHRHFMSPIGNLQLLASGAMPLRAMIHALAQRI